MRTTRITLLLACLLALSLPAAAAESGASVPSPEAKPTAAACPPPGQRLDLAQVSQADCCKGHKGVCGCRAGKIVCCDNSVSPTCTCHVEDPAFTP
jgi:hypothetical protein